MGAHSTPKESNVKQLFNREPAMVLAAVQATLAMVVAFGLDLSAEQIAGIMGASAAILGLVVRKKVSPTEG